MESYLTVLIYFPEYYNLEEKRGKKVKVEKEKFVKTAKEIVTKFSGGGTWHENKTGIWFDEGVLYHDEIRIYEFGIEDKKENRNRIIQYVRKVLLKRFKQVSIYVKFVPYTESVDVKVT